MITENLDFIENKVRILCMPGEDGSSSCVVRTLKNLPEQAVEKCFHALIIDHQYV